MKPTPLQARALRLLAMDEAARIHHYGRGRVGLELDLPWRVGQPTAEYEARRAREKPWEEARKEAGLKRLRLASVEAMERAGWVARQDPDQGWGRHLLTEAGRDMVAMLEPADFEDKRAVVPPLMAIELMLDGLRDRWAREDGWVWFSEFAIVREGMAHGRRLDALAVNRWGGKRTYERMGFEIKRSRSDFLGEVRDPYKRVDGQGLVDRFWYVTPAGLVQAAEVPGECGLVWIDVDGRVAIKRKAPRLAQAPTDRRLVGAILTYMVDRPEQREWRKAMKEQGY